MARIHCGCSILHIEREIVIYAVKLQKSAGSDRFGMFILINVSDDCLYSATVKRQHFNCLGQVLRQNCWRLLQTFQIFVSSATPTLV